MLESFTFLSVTVMDQITIFSACCWFVEKYIKRTSKNKFCSRFLLTFGGRFMLKELDNSQPHFLWAIINSAAEFRKPESENWKA